MLQNTSEGAYVTFDVDDRDAGTFKHTFDGPAPSLLLAVSPKQSGVTFTTASDYQVTLPATYSNYVPETTNALMVGTPDGVTPNKFNFTHTCALLKITYANVPVGTTAFVLEASENISGTVSLTGTDLSDIEIANDNAGLTGSKVTLNLKNTVTATNSTVTFCVPVPTGSYDILEIYLKTADGKIAATDKSINKTITLNRGDVFTFPTVTLTAATVLTENFYSSKATENNYDCSSAFSTAANRADFDYTWSVGSGSSYVFTNGVRLGTGSATASIETSNMISGIDAGKVFAVKVYGAVWNTDGGKISVTYNGSTTTLDAANSAITTTTGTYSSSAFSNPTVFYFAKAESKNTLTIASSLKRIIIDKVEVVYGIVEQLPQVATPTFSEDEGDVDYETNLTISCATVGASIYYTTDGSTPDPTEPSQLYSGAITITDDVTVKAIAVKEDYRASAMASASYTVPQVATPSIDLKSNVITITCGTLSAQIRYTTDGTEPTGSSTLYSSTITVNPSDEYTLKAKAFKSGMKPSEMATRAIAYDDGSPVADPTFSKTSGTTWEYSTYITISSETEGSTIYYTTNGTTPTTSSSSGTAGAHTASVLVAPTMKAIAYKGGSSSDVSTATYNVTSTFTYSNSGGMTTTGGAQSGTLGSAIFAIANGALNEGKVDIRIYSGSSGTFSVPSGLVITKIVLTCTASGTSDYGPGKLSSSSGYSYSGKVGTWTGSANSVTLSASAQVRMTQVVVTYTNAPAE